MERWSADLASLLTFQPGMGMPGVGDMSSHYSAHHYPYQVLLNSIFSGPSIISILIRQVEQCHTANSAIIHIIPTRIQQFFTMHLWLISRLKQHHIITLQIWAQLLPQVCT